MLNVVHELSANVVEPHDIHGFDLSIVKVGCGSSFECSTFAGCLSMWTRSGN